MHVVSEQEFTLALAEEFIERDLLKTFVSTHPLNQYNFWQILFIVATFILEGDSIVLGTYMQAKTAPYEQLCEAEFLNLKN